MTKEQIIRKYLKEAVVLGVSIGRGDYGDYGNVVGSGKILQLTADLEEELREDELKETF